MSGREVREYTNLTDPKDRKWGKGKERIDEEDITFQRMVAKMQEVAGERGGYLHGRGALDSDDLLYLKEQMDAEEDAERLLRRTEKRAFAAFKRAAILADSSPSVLPLPLRVEPKPKSGIRQQDLLKNVLEIRPKRHRVSSPTDVKEKDQSSAVLAVPVPKTGVTESITAKVVESITAKVVSTSAVLKGEASEALTPEVSSEQEKVVKSSSDAKSLLGLSYESSDEED